MMSLCEPGRHLLVLFGGPYYQMIEQQQPGVSFFFSLSLSLACMPPPCRTDIMSTGTTGSGVVG
jgi:hypothetical protein